MKKLYTLFYIFPIDLLCAVLISQLNCQVLRRGALAYIFGGGQGSEYILVQKALDKTLCIDTELITEVQALPLHAGIEHIEGLSPVTAAPVCCCTDGRTHGLRLPGKDSGRRGREAVQSPLCSAASSGRAFTAADFQQRTIQGSEW